MLPSETRALVAQINAVTDVDVLRDTLVDLVLMHDSLEVQRGNLYRDAGDQPADGWESGGLVEGEWVSVDDIQRYVAASITHVEDYTSFAVIKKLVDHRRERGLSMKEMIHVISASGASDHECDVIVTKMILMEED